MPTKTSKKISKKVARSVAAKKISKKKGTTSPTEQIPLKTVKVAKKVSKKTSSTASPTSTSKDARTPAKKRAAPSMSIHFAEGTDMRTALEEIIKGGGSRGDVASRLTEMWKEHPTRTGREKPVSTIINHVVRRALANGYVIEQQWRLVKADGSTPTMDEIPADNKTRNARVANATDPKKVARKSVKKVAKKNADRVLAEGAGLVKPAKKVAKRRTKA